MKLISYNAIQSGIVGISNLLIRLRLRTTISHNEIMFEPGDGVDHLMPDGTAQPDSNGAYWCASSSSLEKLPKWSRRRSGKLGGVRFKRIVPDNTRWIIRDTKRDPVHAAKVFILYEGQPYDWKLIFNFVSWFTISLSDGDDDDKKVCSEICAIALGIEEAWRIDPPTLDRIVQSEQFTN